MKLDSPLESNEELICKRNDFNNDINDENLLDYNS